MKLTAIVLTKDEEKQIVACLGTLQWCDERIVFDCFSHDATVARAREAGAKVRQRVWDNYAAQRNAALATAQGEWVLFVDADERVTPALADEVQARLAEDDADVAGYWISRQNQIVGKTVRGGGWYPDYQLRLLRRGRARYDPTRPVHEVVLLDGEAGHLTNHLIHYNYTSWAQFRAKQRRYSKMEAARLYQDNVEPRLRSLVGQPAREFWRRYIHLQGHTEGWHGLVLSLYMAWYTFTTYFYLLRLHRKARMQIPP